MADDPRPTPVPPGRRGLPGGRDEAWALIDTLPVPVAVHDLSDSAANRFLNAAFTETFGYTAADVPDLASWARLAYPDPVYRAEVIDGWWAEITARRAGGSGGAPREYRVVDKAGRTRNVLIGFALQGDVVFSTLQDVTDIRATEAALEAERRKTERIAHALTENMPGGAYTMVLRPGETMAQFAFLSERFLQMLDLRREEAVGDPSVGFSRVHPDDRANWIAWNAEAFATRTPFSREARIVAHGQTRWIRAESIPRELEDGSVIWEGILVDITRLKEAERKLSAVLDAARAFVWTLDIARQTVTFNERWARVSGQTSGARTLALDSWMDSVHPDDRATVRQSLAALLQPGTEVTSSVYRRRFTAEGDWVWMQVHGGVVERGPDGTPLVASGVSFDITEEVNRRLHDQDVQAQLREDLQRAQQRDTVAQVAGAVAHDLNNLIGLVVWTLESLEPEVEGQEALSIGFARIRRAVDMARELVAGLGGLMRPAAPRAVHDLRDLLRSGIELLGSRRIARHDIRLDLPEVPLPAWAGPTELLQVIMNLGTNACDAGGPDRAATVTVTAMPPGTPMPARRPEAGECPRKDRKVSIFRIADTGAGMGPEVLARIFQRNFTTKGDRGAGLGLPIVASILQDNHACLWVDSRPGEGTVMTVAWPAGPEDPVEAAGPRHPAEALPPPRPVDPRLLDGVQVLVVDDLPDVAKVLAAMLESAGAAAFAETDPAFVQEVLSDAPEEWSVLVTDLHMPGTDGLALARFAAGLSPPVPVVLVTARPDTLADVSLQDFAAVLAKPVSRAELAQAVRAAADRRGTPRTDP